MRGRFPMGRRCGSEEGRWRSVRRYAFSEGRCAFAAEKGRRRENRGQGERAGARCAHRNKKRNARMRRAGMLSMRRSLWPMRTWMMLAR